MSKDGVAIAQYLYTLGRSRRFVLEYGNFFERYCYVLLPGLDYELFDFATRLSLSLRKGILYKKIHSSTFPDIMKIKFKDSYKNFGKYKEGKINHYYNLILTSVANFNKQKIFKYHTNDSTAFCTSRKGFSVFEEIFDGTSYLSKELMDSDRVKKYFDIAKSKTYFASFLDRIAFIQQFYKTHGT